MRIIEKIELIYRDPKIRGGRPCIVGTGLRVMDIVSEQQFGEKDPEKIAALYDIKLSKVYAALAYYHVNKEEIDVDMQEDDDFIVQAKKQALGSRAS